MTLFLTIIATLAAVGSAIWAYSSASVAKQQLRLLTRKIGMVSEPEKMTEILPLWYIERMSRDHWCFGLLLSSGYILAINQITGISDDKMWMEVHLAAIGDGPDEIFGIRVLYAPTDRESASVRIDQIQSAFELVTS